jgi:peptidoglycan/xylan/chitin deacetylase (PgdA/CDA1 family)
MEKNSEVLTAALTFDDGPSPCTELILDTLEKHNAKATFFVVGNLAGTGKSTIKRAFDMGCEIAGHSWTHRNLPTLTPTEIELELSDTTAAITAITGVCPKVFRPPYGAVSDTLKNACSKAGLPIINWSVDPLDWEHKNAEIIYDKIMENLHNRAIILSHDIYASTAEAMTRVIPELIRRGYRLVTVSELFCCAGITPQAGAVYDNG